MTARLSILSLSLALLVACGDGHNHDDLVGEKREGGHHHHHHGPVTELGGVEVLGQKWSVGYSMEMKAGGEIHVSVNGFGGGEVGEIRAWVGSEDGVGSEKALLAPHGDHLDGHVFIPDPLPANAQLWLSVGLPAGQSMTKAFDFPAN